MLEPLKIWIDRLTDGKTQKIRATLAPSFLDVEEKELIFPSPVAVQGEAYLADAHLVVRLKASTQATMPCTICNEMINIDLKIENFYHTEALEEVRSGVFDCSDALREALLLELPQYVECCQGSCPERSRMAPYLRNANKQASELNKPEQSHFPFSDL